MQASLRTLSRTNAAKARQFSTSANRQSFARLTLCGNLIKQAEKSTDKNGKPFIKWVVATDGPAAKKPDGTFGEKSSTFHNVLQYFGTERESLLNIPKGSLVNVDAEYRFNSEKQQDGTYKDRVTLLFNKIDVLKRGKAEDGSVPTGAPLSNTQNIFGNNV